MTTSSKLATGNGFPNIVVTGIAMTTALATDAETTWKMLLDGQSGIRTLDDPFVEEFDLPVRIGGHLLEEFDSQLDRVENRRMGYLQKMATVLNRRVWENAGSPEVDTNRLMVSVGTGMGSIRGADLRLRRHARTWHESGLSAGHSDVHAQRRGRGGRAANGTPKPG